MELLEAGSGWALSDEFEITEETAIFLGPSGQAAPTARGNILRKTAAGNFAVVANLVGKRPSGRMPPGFYKVERLPGTASFSIEHG